MVDFIGLQQDTTSAAACSRGLLRKIPVLGQVPLRQRQIAELFGRHGQVTLPRGVAGVGLGQALADAQGTRLRVSLAEEFSLDRQSQGVNVVSVLSKGQ